MNDRSLSHPRFRRPLIGLGLAGMIGGAAALVVAFTALPESRMAEDDSVLTRPSAAADSTIAYGQEPEQVADVRFGKLEGQKDSSERGGRQRPLVVIVHGGFWRPAYDSAHTGPMATALAEAGWTVASIEYRRVPGQPGLTLSDVALAIERLPEKVTGHSGRVILIGHSAGGHLVLWAASNSEPSTVAGVVALAPVADLQLADARGLGSGAVRAFLGGDSSGHPEIDPVRRSSPTVPVVIVHGTADDTVPIEIARSYVAVHAATRLVALEGVGHYAVIDPRSAAWPAVVAELLRLSN